jgi:hypothetical protein
VDINGGWSDNGNLIAGGPIDLGGSSDIILEIVVESNTSPQNQLMRSGLPPFINTYSNCLLSDVELFNTSPHDHHNWA